MSSLFDIAAGLSQFDGDGSGDEGPWSSDPKESGGKSSTPEQECWEEYGSSRPRASSVKFPAQRRQSALCILDETLQTIYDTRRSSSPMTPTAASLSASKTSEQLENRLQQLNATTPSLSVSAPSLVASLSHSGAASELRNVYSRSIAYQQQLEAATLNTANATRAELKPPAASSKALQAQNGGDPDMLAKTVLREIGDEIEQLTTAATPHDHRSPEQRDAIVRFLTSKYIDARLNKLPGTPFVQLARRKALQKIQQLSHGESGQPQGSSETAAAASVASRPQKQDQWPRDASELWEKLSALPPSQREVLQKLTRVPEAQVSLLPPKQRELVQFAKRLERARAISDPFRAPTND